MQYKLPYSQLTRNVARNIVKTLRRRRIKRNFRTYKLCYISDDRSRQVFVHDTGRTRQVLQYDLGNSTINTL